MKIAYAIAASVILLISSANAMAQQAGDSVDVGPGIKMNANGGIEVSEMTAEIYHFTSDWTISEQHDVMEPAAPTGEKTPLPPAGKHVLTGVFTTGSGPFNLTETTTADAAKVTYSADMTSSKEIGTNELSVSFALPTEIFSGKAILIDGQPFTLPADPRKKGEAHLVDKENIHQVELTTPTGTLILTGNLNFLVQDDREWDDQRYDLRLHFTPSTGQVKESKIEFQMEWKPVAAK